MLTIARTNAGADERCKGVDVRFVHHDITDFDTVAGKELGRGQGGYDCVTCALALPLLEEPGRAMRMWARFLRTGGRMVGDVPTEGHQFAGWAFEHAVAEVGIVVPFGRLRVTGKGWLEGLMWGAGMAVARSFVARGYGSAGVYAGDKGGEVFDRWVEGPVGDMMGGIKGDQRRRARAREVFMREFARRAGAEGKVRDAEGFYVVVGKKT